jgi:hypothetical protein
MADFSRMASEIVALLAIAGPYLKGAAPYVTEAVKSLAQTAGKELGGDMVKKAGALLQSLRDRFRQDNNAKAEQTLDLFQEDPETFEGALSKLLLKTLNAHPEWAKEVRQLLADEALQEIIARNGSVVQRIEMDLQGGGTQRIDADNSEVTDVKMCKR